MANSIAHKVEQIVISQIDNEKFGVSELAHELGLSRSQVLRRAKAETGKSVNQLIREIRLAKGAEYLIKDELTSSEIAYRVGFSSPSYFNKCFLDHFGVTPGEYKSSQERGKVVEQNSAGPTIRWWGKRTLVASIFFAITAVAIVVSLLKLSSKPTYDEVSIAVLPLEDFSENNDKEYLAFGITEAITEALARNKYLRVISRGSAMRYKGTDHLYPEIANELGVRLLLEGSVMHVDGRMRIVVQLIDPFPEEKHLWQESYTEDQGNILGLVQDVSGMIAKEIFSTLQIDAEEEQKSEIDNRAYELYLKGRHLWNTQNISKNALLTAVDYLEEALRIAPDFARAYVTLAETYIAINTLIGDNEEKMKFRENAQKAIDKALELDQNLAEAYITKGNLAGKLDWNWKTMKEMAEKSLELEPSNASAYLTLSNYYVVTGDYEQAIEEALKAGGLDPINPQVGVLIAERYYIAGDYDRSIEKLLEVIDLNPNYGFAYNNIGFVYFKAGYIEKAIDAWQNLQLVMGNQALHDCYDEHPYQYCFNFFIDNAKKNDPRFCNNPVIIASVQMLLADEVGALEFLDIARRYKNEDLPVMVTYPDFYSLRSNPEFQKIISDVGVSLPL